MKYLYLFLRILRFYFFVLALRMVLKQLIIQHMYLGRHDGIIVYSVKCLNLFQSKLRNLNATNYGLIKSSITFPVINYIIFVLARAVDEVSRAQAMGEEVWELSHSFFCLFIFSRKFRKKKLISRKRLIEFQYDSTTHQGK